MLLAGLPEVNYNYLWSTTIQYVKICLTGHIVDTMNNKKYITEGISRPVYLGLVQGK